MLVQKIPSQTLGVGGGYSRVFGNREWEVNAEALEWNGARHSPVATFSTSLSDARSCDWSRGEPRTDETVRHSWL